MSYLELFDADPRSSMSPGIIKLWRKQEFKAVQHNETVVHPLHTNKNSWFPPADYVNATRFQSQNTINHVRMVLTVCYFNFLVQGSFEKQN